MFYIGVAEKERTEEKRRPVLNKTQCNRLVEIKWDERTGECD